MQWTKRSEQASVSFDANWEAKVALTQGATQPSKGSAAFGSIVTKVQLLQVIRAGRSRLISSNGVVTRGAP